MNHHDQEKFRNLQEEGDLEDIARNRIDFDQLENKQHQQHNLGHSRNGDDMVEINLDEGSVTETSPQAKKTGK